MDFARLVLPLSFVAASAVALLPVRAGAPGDEAITVQLTLAPRDGMALIGYYQPQRLELSETKPETLEEMPPDVTAPRFGVLPIAGPQGAVYHVGVDEPEGKPYRLFVDANGNGDLTDDAAAEWTPGKPQTGKEGKSLTMYMGGAMVNLGGDNPFVVHLAMYRFDPNHTQRAQLKNMLLYYRDYCRQGQITIGGAAHKAILSDETASGDFRGKGVNLLLDVNSNGRFDRRGESFDVSAPFNIGGVTYEIRDLTADGASFKIVKSSRSVA